MPDTTYSGRPGGPRGGVGTGRRPTDGPEAGTSERPRKLDAQAAAAADGLAGRQRARRRESGGQRRPLPVPDVAGPFSGPAATSGSAGGFGRRQSHYTATCRRGGRPRMAGGEGWAGRQDAAAPEPMDGRRCHWPWDGPTARANTDRRHDAGGHPDADSRAALQAPCLVGVQNCRLLVVVRICYSLLVRQWAVRVLVVVAGRGRRCAYCLY